MIRSPASRARSGRRVAQTLRVGPPVGGWNARDPYSAMKETDAIRLDNFTCGVGEISLRRGYAVHATGLDGIPAETLMSYTNSAGVKKLFASTTQDIYDVTVAGAPVAAVEHLTNGRWSHTLFANASGTTLHCVNGQANPRMFNGSTWSAPSWTGLTITNLIVVHPHMNRLWFVEKNTMNLWYGGVGAITGALTKLDIGPLCRFGGSLATITTLSRDGGRGSEAVLVAITTQGEVVVYAGTDPSSASTWGLVGVYRIPRPIGRRCVIQAGGDIGVLTESGLLPLAAVMGVASTGQALAAVTNKIEPAFRAAYEDGGSWFGWEIAEYPRDGLIIVNVPTVQIEDFEAVPLGETHQQFVMKAATGAWSRWRDIGASCWALHDGDLYFGGVRGQVYRYGFSDTDAGAFITAEARTAYQFFGSADQKLVSMIRPEVTTTRNTRPAVAMTFDLSDREPNYPFSASVSLVDTWGVGVWGRAIWGGRPKPQMTWRAARGQGSSISIGLKIQAKGRFELNGFSLLAERGGPL